MAQIEVRVFDVSFKAWHRPTNKHAEFRFIVPIAEPDQDNLSHQCDQALRAQYDLSALDIHEFRVTPITAAIWVPAAPPDWAIPSRRT